MNRLVATISGRLSLRTPQRIALERLARVVEIAPPRKDADVASALAAITSEFPSVIDFERDFPSLCFALATGVGKTRLMGAFIAYLYLERGFRHFFVLAPNLTIYDKLIRDFTPNTPKYVLQGLAEFASEPPEVITGDNYESGRGVRGTDLFGDRGVHVNVFNISKINAEVRGGKAPRIKRLSECIGNSYFEYLAGLDDLVLIMDESHRYRADRGVQVLNELKPILGLELTATPFVERAGGQVAFRNVIYTYALGEAIHDGFVKEPAVATRSDFDPRGVSDEELEKLKLEDGVRLHENTKVALDVYARQKGLPVVKPFLLVVARDTAHADRLQTLMQHEEFFEGRYHDRVIQVHSGLSGAEKDETIQKLLAVESPDERTEIVIHVNMLKEGWDVTNLFTIVPLRAATARTLVEQTIGRGLRLPYGKRTGVLAVDRLTIVAHDKFQEIVDEANRPDSPIRFVTVVVGADVPLEPQKPVVVPSVIESILRPANDAPLPEQTVILFPTPRDQEVAAVTLEVIREYERLPRSSDLKRPDIQAEIVAKVRERVRPVQGVIAEVSEDVAPIVARTTALVAESLIDIPRIIVVPKGEVTAGFRDFDLDASAVRYPPVSREIYIEWLQSHVQERLFGAQGMADEDRPENYLVRGLMDFDDISYDHHAELLYRLAGQLVAHLRSYLSSEDDVVNVLRFHQKSLAALIHAQMQAHYEEAASEGYEAQVSRGFRTLRPNVHAPAAGESTRDFRMPVEGLRSIRGMLFGGFEKCLYPAQRFDSDAERRFAVMLENEAAVLKWFKPAPDHFRIDYRGGAYEPDFVAETADAKYMCEPKLASELDDPMVREKAKAAVVWCEHATGHELAHGGKPWRYLLIPNDAIQANSTLAGLAKEYVLR